MLRLRIVLLAALLALAAAPAAAAGPLGPQIEHGPHAGLLPPAPVFDPLKSFKIEILPF